MNNYRPKRSNLVRIDVELEEMIKNLAKKNDISLREASREIARANKKKFMNKIVVRELKF